MKITDLKKILAELSKEELSKDIAIFFKNNEFIRDYYISKYEDSSSILIKHKSIINNEFLPNKGYGKGRLSVAKKAITEFKKLMVSNHDIAELMIFYVETGVKYTNTYGDIDEAFYYSMESMFERAIKLIEKNNLHDKFENRCLKIIHETYDLGWGFHDQLSSTYYEAFPK